VTVRGAERQAAKGMGEFRDVPDRDAVFRRKASSGVGE
jgi:hypothetical protein